MLMKILCVENVFERQNKVVYQLALLKDNFAKSVESLNNLELMWLCAKHSFSCQTARCSLIIV